MNIHVCLSSAATVITMFYIQFVAYGLVFVTSILAIVGAAKVKQRKTC